MDSTPQKRKRPRETDTTVGRLTRESIANNDPLLCEVCGSEHLHIVSAGIEHGRTAVRSENGQLTVSDSDDYRQAVWFVLQCENGGHRTVHTVAFHEGSVFFDRDFLTTTRGPVWTEIGRPAL